MNLRHLVRCLLLAAVLAIAPSARAHPGHYHPDTDEVDEFARDNALNTGFLHPFGGLDHVLSLLAIGCAAGLAFNSRGLVTGVFTASLLAGGGAAAGEFILPGFPAAVAVCVLAAGVSMTLPNRSPKSLPVWIAAGFGLWQGNAHSTMIPAPQLLLPYGLGYIAASVGLLWVGLALGRQIGRRSRSSPACPAPAA